MRGHGFTTVAQAWAEVVRTHQTGNACVDMHDSTAGEIKGAFFKQPSTGAPDHVGDGQVGEGDPDQGKDNHGGEFDAFGQASHDQCAGNAGECRLKGGKADFRNRAGHDVFASVQVGHAAEEQTGKTAEKGIAFSERNGVTVDEPDHNGQ